MRQNATYMLLTTFFVDASVYNIHIIAYNIMHILYSWRYLYIIYYRMLHIYLDCPTYMYNIGAYKYIADPISI